MITSDIMNRFEEVQLSFFSRLLNFQRKNNLFCGLISTDSLFLPTNDDSSYTILLNKFLALKYKV